MNYRFIWLLGPAVALARCVSGDDSNVADAGQDATQSDAGKSDVTQSDASSDVLVDVPTPPPTPDGSLVFLNHYNNNVVPGDNAFADLAVNENGGLTYVVAGKFETDPSAGNQYHFGTINLGPATGSDLLTGGVGASGASVWATSATSTNANNDQYFSVAVDAQGNLYVLGTTDGTSVKFKDTLPGPTTFVAKLTATGTPLWDHAFSTSGGGVAGPMRLVLSGGQVIVAMTFYDNITYDTAMTYSTANDSGASQGDVFVAQLDASSGATKWSGVYGNPNASDSVTALSATADGSVILAGNMGGTMTALAGNITGSGLPLSPNGDGGGGEDAYVLKIDGTGKALYGVVFGESQLVLPSDVAFRDGTIALSVRLVGALDFGKGTVTSQGVDGVVLTIDETTKKTNFVAQLTGAATDSFSSVTLDPWDEVIATGTYGDSSASAQIGAQALPQTSLGVGGMVLAKWDAKGTLLWAHGFVPTLDGGAPPYATPDVYNVHQNISPFRVQTTSTGQIVIAGAMTGGADFGKGYAGQLSTLEWGKCTCAICNALCFLGSPPACCHTPIPGNAGDGIIGVWQP